MRAAAAAVLEDCIDASGSRVVGPIRRHFRRLRSGCVAHAWCIRTDRLARGARQAIRRHFPSRQAPSNVIGMSAPISTSGPPTSSARAPQHVSSAARDLPRRHHGWDRRDLSLSFEITLEWHRGDSPGSSYMLVGAVTPRRSRAWARLMRAASASARRAWLSSSSTPSTWQFV